MATTPEQWLELAADAERQAGEARARGDDELAGRLLRRSEGRRRMSEVEARLESLGLTDPLDPAKLSAATLLRGIGPDQATEIVDEVERLRTELSLESDHPLALKLYEGAGHALMGADYRDLRAMLLAQASAEREIDVVPLARLARLDDAALAQAAERSG